MTLGDATAIRRAVVGREISVREVCRAALDRIYAGNPTLNAFITVDEEGAMARAAQLDSGASGLANLPLAGVPVAIKDNICTRGRRTTAGSRVLEHYVPPYSATVVDRLERAGAVIVGKTNCDEFAMGSSTEHSAFGVARNPWDPSRTPGGSSGGSAISVATSMTPLALGSETGGSVRQPAAMCGVLGLKPTYGRISRYGLIAFSSSMDQVGPFAATCADLATILGVLAGPDPRDATCSDQPPDDYRSSLDRGAAKLRIGVPVKFLAEGIEPGVRIAFDAALEKLRRAGAVISEIELPHARFATPTYAIVATAEASSNLGRFDGVRYGYRAPGDLSLRDMYAQTRAAFGREVKRRIMLGTYVLSGGYYDAFYVKAQKVRSLLRQDYEIAFNSVDLIAMPTSPTTAFPLGARVEDPLQMYLADLFTASANLTGLPAISVPCGLSSGLPVGLQLTGRAWAESILLQAAAEYERWSGLSTAPPDAA